MMDRNQIEYNVRFDQRSKELLVASIRLVRESISDKIMANDITDDIYTRYDELQQLERGILFATPTIPAPIEEVDTEEKE